MNDLTPLLAEPATLKDLLELNPCNGAPKIGRRRYWTNREEAIVREAYPAGGVGACLPLLPGRTAATIYQKAAKLGVNFRNADGTARERRRFKWTPAQDDAVRRVYTGDPDLGAVKRLAATLMRPRSAISGRAQKLGLVVPRFKSPPWCEAEHAILRAHWTQHPGTIRRKLKAEGYSRTVTAILLMRKRFGRLPEDDSGALGAAEVAEVFGVSRETVARWLDAGWLTGKRVQSHVAPERAAPHLRAHWRIGRRALREFVIANVGVLDFRKLDKFWLIDLMADANAMPPRGQRRDSDEAAA